MNPRDSYITDNFAERAARRKQTFLHGTLEGERDVRVRGARSLRRFYHLRLSQVHTICLFCLYYTPTTPNPKWLS